MICSKRNTDIKILKFSLGDFNISLTGFLISRVATYAGIIYWVKVSERTYLMIVFTYVGWTGG